MASTARFSLQFVTSTDHCSPSIDTLTDREKELMHTSDFSTLLVASVATSLRPSTAHKRIDHAINGRRRRVNILENLGDVCILVTAKQRDEYTFFI